MIDQPFIFYIFGDFLKLTFLLCDVTSHVTQTGICDVTGVCGWQQPPWIHKWCHWTRGLDHFSKCHHHYNYHYNYNYSRKSKHCDRRRVERDCVVVVLNGSHCIDTDGIHLLFNMSNHEHNWLFCFILFIFFVSHCHFELALRGWVKQHIN